MNTRREMAISLLGLPLITAAAQSQTQTNALEKIDAEPQPERNTPPQPNSVDAASIISYTLYAEARGEPWEGKAAVASVIITRAMRNKISLSKVCLQNKQFSCWNDLAQVPDSYLTGEGIQPADMKARSQCFGIAWILMRDMLTGNSQNWDYFTHFYNPDKATPDWAFELKGTRIIGRHLFGYIE